MLEIKQDVPLAPHSTYRIGGRARYATTCENEDDVREALTWARVQHAQVRALGSGSNTLVGDDGFGGLIIWYKNAAIEIDASQARVRAAGGALTAAVSGAAVREGLTGFEWAAGVPGTIGGAVCGNAGASGSEMKDVVTAVQAMDGDGTVHIYAARDCAFGYRHSRFKETHEIILSVELALTRAGDVLLPQRLMCEVLQYRTQTQPKGVATCGCAFKNYDCRTDEIETLRSRGVPEKFLVERRVPAGWLIEHSQLKDTCVGGACVSSVHGNFITVAPDARAGDVLALVALIKAQVQEQFGVALTEEIAVLQ